jgi:NIPSNAP
MAGVIEIRTYRAEPGQRELAIEVLRDRIIPAQREAGMQIVGPFPSAEDSDVLVWFRGFSDEASRDAICKEFYGSALWKEELEGQIRPALAEINVAVIEDAADLWSNWPEA